mmetsp:Transcript_1742/g.2622  ORF Transcript_1742/g.2622 Transcript_1742/m.2622 type:complete len:239 (-) Transcript_1742:19-735(-)
MVGVTTNCRGHSRSEAEIRIVELTDTNLLQLGQQIHKSKENVCIRGKYNGIDVVVKRAIISRPDSIDKFEEEAKVLCNKNLKDTVVQPIAIVRAPPHYSIVLPYFERGSLLNLVKENGPVSTDIGLALAMDMAQALIAVHNSNRIHRDFKTANILINNQCKALLTDFGSSVASNVACSDPMDELAPTHNKRFRPSQPSGGFHKQIIDGTTLGYTAPEILCNKVATKAADIYGFAITMS